MPTLHIEHPITDLDTWLGAFDAFAAARAQAGVVGETVRHPLGDPTAIVVDLEFETAERASSFRDFLRTTVWADPAASPALAGEPVATILETVER